MIHLYLIRHGETKLNAINCYQGKSDLSLSRAGIEQINKLKQRIGSLHLDVILVSPTMRTKQTAQILVGDTDVPVIMCKELTEIDFGEWEGLTYVEVQHKFPDDLRKYEADPLTYKPQGGETFTEVLNRVKKVVVMIQKSYRGKSVAIVGHGGWVQSLLCYLLKITPSTRWQFKLQPAAVVTVKILDDNHVVVESIS